MKSCLRNGRKLCLTLDLSLLSSTHFQDVRVRGVLRARVLFVFVDNAH